MVAPGRPFIHLHHKNAVLLLRPLELLNAAQDRLQGYDHAQLYAVKYTPVSEPTPDSGGVDDATIAVPHGNVCICSRNISRHTIHTSCTFRPKPQIQNPLRATPMRTPIPTLSQIPTTPLQLTTGLPLSHGGPSHKLPGHHHHNGRDFPAPPRNSGGKVENRESSAFAPHPPSLRNFVGRPHRPLRLASSIAALRLALCCCRFRCG